MLFQKKQNIGDYIVAFPIKQGAYAETYRVKDGSNKNYFLKLINVAKLHRSQFDSEGNVLEESISKIISHPNLEAYHASGDIVINSQQYVYLVYDFISGETAAEKFGRERACDIQDAISIVCGVLEGLNYLHNLPYPVIHNGITAQNVMLDMSDGISVPRIIDFGTSSFVGFKKKFYRRDDYNPFYMSPEALNGVFSPQSDIFAAGALLYHILWGIPPYFVDLSNNLTGETNLVDVIAIEREKPLRIFANNGKNADENLTNTILKALALNVDERFQTAGEFIKALRGEIKVTPPQSTKTKPSENQDFREKTIQPQSKASTFSKLEGKGFTDVGGLEELKEQVRAEIIDILHNAEEAKRLGVNIPNGLLLYGPPGCGKTFFAQKLAEELGCSFRCIHCSDIATPYIHGGQEKIAAIFEEARACAPSIICMDELDSMVMNRNLQNTPSESGEVNEFLVQLNNCGQHNVFVIGATNNADKIDPAVLRSGRLENHYYIGLPDNAARKKIFQVYLKQDIADESIDFDRLAELTEGFISADIKKIVETSGRLLMRRKIRSYNMTVLEEVIAKTSPSLPSSELQRQEEIRNKLEGKSQNNGRPKIGF